MLTVARAVIEINARFREPDAPRFVVKDYPKNKEYRRVKLSPEITTLLREHIQANSLRRDDLLFAMPTPEPAPVPEPAPADDTPRTDSAQLGRTDPNNDGRTYQHGTITAYNLGGCRCQHCRDAYARYRAQRRAAGKDDPRNGGLGRRINTDGHIPRRWFAQHIWKPATTTADLDPHRPRPRPTPRPRLLATRRRRRHPNRQRTPRPRQPAHHREIPAHPARHQRDRPGRAPPHPQPADRVTDVDRSGRL